VGGDALTCRESSMHGSPHVDEMLRRLSDLKLLATFKGLTASQYPSSTHLISRLFSSTLTPPQSSSSTATPPYYSTTHPQASSSSSRNSSSPSITHGSSPSLSEQFSDLAPVILCPQPCRVVVIGWMGSRAKYIKRQVRPSLSGFPLASDQPSSPT
jgi:hypothetical protein